MCLSNCFVKFQYLSDFTIYIDGSNVAYFGFNKSKKPKLSNILQIINYLITEIGFKRKNIHCICDPSLKYYIDNPNEYENLVKEDVIIEAPKVADEFILSFALKHDFCFIISNDRFRQYLDQLPSKQWLEERRISFMIINNEVCLSPNISYENLIKENNKFFSFIRKFDSTSITTLNVMNRIENSEGELDLY